MSLRMIWVPGESFRKYLYTVQPRVRGRSDGNASGCLTPVLERDIDADRHDGNEEADEGLSILRAVNVVACDENLQAHVGHVGAPRSDRTSTNVTQPSLEW